MQEIEDGDEVAFEELVESVRSLDTVDDASGCVCLRTAAAEGKYNGASVYRFKKEKNCTAGRERLGVLSFESVLSTGHVVLASTAVHLLYCKASVESSPAFHS